jgi:hypothetical protein
VKEPPRDTSLHAPGWPGLPARWTSSAKSGIGTALGAASRVWFTLSHGILNEIYYPRVDSAGVFTFFWPGAGHWEGADFRVTVRC